VNITDAINAFFASTEGDAAIGVLVVAFVDFALGVSAALRDDRFELSSLAAFLRKHVMGRVVPIWLLLFVGHCVSGFRIGDVSALLALGLAAATAYLLETVGSIKNAWTPGAIQGTPTD
jgi:hypothetical protein